MLMADVSAGQVRGRQWLGWMDGVTVAFGGIGMTVEAARQWAKDRKESPGAYVDDLSLTRSFMLGPAYFWTALSRSFRLSHGEGQDAVT